MSDILRFFKNFEIWIYILLALVGVVHLRKFFLSLQDWRSTVFNLERDIAQRKLSQNSSILILLLLLGFAEFFMVSFVVPNTPNLQLVHTPTLSLLATPTATLKVVGGQNSLLLSGTPTLPSAGGKATSGCVPGKVEFTYPTNGAEVSKTVALKGKLVVENFGFYKYEYAPAGSSAWMTIAAGNQIKADGSLGFWDTSQLVPGDYNLQLVVTDNKGQNFPACVVSVKVIAP